MPDKAELADLPNDVIRIIQEQILETARGIKTWCKLASTNKRFWRLQLPTTQEVCTFQIGSGLGSLSIAGVVWVLKRLRAASRLEISARGLLSHLRKPIADLLLDLRGYVEAAMKASADLPHLRLLDLRMHASFDARTTLGGLLREWEQALLLGSGNLEAVRISGDGVPCPLVLNTLPKLRYLELNVTLNEGWLEGFLMNVSFCSCLEYLRISVQEVATAKNARRLPSTYLANLSSLKYVDLLGWLPNQATFLPPDCLLRVNAICGNEDLWPGLQESYHSNLSVFWMANVCEEWWPSDLRTCSRLQFVMLICEKCEGEPPRDLAVLKGIPHVHLEFRGQAEVIVPNGSWESLEVQSWCPLRIQFPEADAFVRGTKRFLFSSNGNTELHVLPYSPLKAACETQGVRYYESNYVVGERQPSNPQWEVYMMPTTAHRLSNVEAVMRVEASDGCCSSAGSSQLYRCLQSKHLAKQEDYWYKFEPDKWVFGG